MLLKQCLPIELGTTPEQITTQLQQIKNAMAAAIMHKIALHGIPGDQDPDYATWQTIYLEADCLLAQHSHLPLS
jgi:hypothetical protein